MSNNEVKQAIDIILEKIGKNTVPAWQDDLGETKQVAIMEDFDKNGEGEPFSQDNITQYNGWFDDLIRLKEDLL